jgi:hypothetical protein
MDTDTHASNVRFEPVTQAFEQEQTVHALNRAATVIGYRTTSPTKTKAKNQHELTEPETEMGHVRVQRRRNKKNHKIIQGHQNKNSMDNVKHNKNHRETTHIKRQ